MCFYLNFSYNWPLRCFHLEKEVYLVKIAFASENLENFSRPVRYFLCSIFYFAPQK